MSFQLCERTASTVVIEGSISTLGNQFIVGLTAVNCKTGDALASEQETAEGKERVLNALGVASSRLRSKLGESLATVEKYNLPLVQVTTPSLEALKDFTLAIQSMRASKWESAIPYLKRAVDLDRNFAAAYFLL